MLRHRDNLLILSLAFLSILLILKPPVFAQPVEVTAPWRLETAGTADLLLRERIDINSASLDTLMQIPGMTPDLAQAIMNYRTDVGHIESLEDLRDIEEINDDILEILSNYVKVIHEINAYNISYISRYRQDYPGSNSVSESPYRLSQKLRVEHSSGVVLGVGLDKDPGEEEMWDHSALVLDIPLPSVNGRLILGDYLVGFNHGLVIRTRHNYGLGRYPDGNLHSYPDRVKAYYSWDESIALRGVGLSTQIRQIELSAWASSRYRDARLDENSQITSFYLSGLHRTETEESHANACREETFGTNVAWRWPKVNLNVASTFSAVNWNQPFLFSGTPVSDTKVAGISLGYTYRHVNAMFECAWDNWGQGAQMADVQLRSGLCQSTVALYHVDPNYFAPLASILDFEQGEVNNREGVYSHIKVYSTKGFVSGFIHLYRFPKRLPTESWGGKDFSLYGKYKGPRGVESSLSSRWVQEEEAETLNMVSRWRGTASVSIFPVENWRIEPKLRLCNSHQADNLGYLIGAVIKGWWRISSKSSLVSAFGSGYYDADDHSQRLYWIEYDLSHSMRVKPLWGRGALVEIELTLKHMKWGNFYVKALWDQPHNFPDRSPTRSITIACKYPK